MNESPIKNLNLINIELMEYEKALHFQHKLIILRKNNKIFDTLILMEHPHVYTIGLVGKRKNVLISDDELYEMNIKLIHVKRGGDVTYHGPGQIIGYCIIKFNEFDKTIKQFVHCLEEVFIRLLKVNFFIDSFRERQYPGVWTKKGKIVAIGIRIKKGILYHGFAFNVNTNLKYFKYIIPCGISGKEVTSLASITNAYQCIENLKDLIVKSFSEIFMYNLCY